MPQINRRGFLASAASVAANGNGLLAAARGSGAVDEVLRSGIVRRKIPAVVAMAAGENKMLYAGAFGLRDSSGAPVRVDSIFQIASARGTSR